MTGGEALIAAVAGVAVGFVVGFLGLGASILTVPALMLLLDLPATRATGTALIVVVVVAAIGLLVHAPRGRVDVRAGLLFALPGVVAATAGGRLSALLPDDVLTVALIGLVTGAGMWMWRRRPPEQHSVAPPRWRLVATGSAMGLMTGTLGVGGGFVIVPSLVGLLGLPMVVAIGTSQLVLVVNAAGGLIGRVGSGTVDPVVGLAFAGAGAVGAMLGGRLVGRWGERRLSRAFATVLAVVAVALLAELAGLVG